MSQHNRCAKIALLLPNLSGGGAERVMVTLANEFSRTVAQVDVIIINDDDLSYSRELSKRVNLINLSTGRAGRSVLAIRGYLKESAPDVLLSTLGHMSSAAAIALIALPRNTTRFFVREDLAPRNVTLSEPFLFAISKVQKWAYTRADGIIALCNDMATEMSNYYNIDTPIYTVYNPVRIVDITMRAADPISPKLPWSEECKFALGVGRLEQQKDFITLLKAVAEVRKTHDLKLVILGEGGERKNLHSTAKELQIEESVFMPGFVSNPFAFMRASTVYVLSSEREGLPNALVQAQICETECIATRCPTGPREILRDGEYGALVEIGDHHAMAAEIAAVLINKSKRTPSADVLSRNYHPENIADQYLKVLLG